jgi:4-carboxymuconolactone decarboxylase
MNLQRLIGWLLPALAICAAANAQERLAPIAPDQYTEEQRKVIAEVAKGPRTEMFSPLNPMLRSPQLAYTAERFGETVYYTSTLDKPIYELTVLLLARQTMQQFEWRAHYANAIKAGIAQEAVDEIAAGRRPAHLKEDERIAYDFVVDVFKFNQVSDAHYAKFQSRFGDRAVVDLVGLLGYYETIAIMMNVNRTALNPGTAPLLKPLAKPFP